jgi:hypothetical protein
MTEQTIVDVLEQERHWVRRDGSSVLVDALDPSEAQTVLTSLQERASLLWFAAMWRADRSYTARDVPAANVVSPLHWLDDRPLVQSLQRVVRRAGRRAGSLTSVDRQAFATPA